MAAVVSIGVHLIVLQAGATDELIETIPDGGISRDNAFMALLAPLFPMDWQLAKLFGIKPAPYYQFVRYSWAIMTELIFYWILFFYALSARHFGARIAGFGFLLAAFVMFVVGTANYNEFFQGTSWAAVVARIPFVPSSVGTSFPPWRYGIPPQS